MTKQKKKVRKPRTLKLWCGWYQIFGNSLDGFEAGVEFCRDGECIDVSSLRRLAKWCLAAADYLESREG